MCPPQQLSGELCHQVNQCQEAKGDNLLPRCHAEHPGEGESCTHPGQLCSLGRRRWRTDKRGGSLFHLCSPCSKWDIGADGPACCTASLCPREHLSRGRGSDIPGAEKVVCKRPGLVHAHLCRLGIQTRARSKPILCLLHLL